MPAPKRIEYADLHASTRAAIKRRVLGALGRFEWSTADIFTRIHDLGGYGSKSPKEEPMTIACLIDCLRDLESSGEVRSRGSAPELWSLPR